MVYCSQCDVHYMPGSLCPCGYRAAYEDLRDKEFEELYGPLLKMQIESIVERLKK